ncbi:MAG: acyltransferase family protein [Ardenticatenales bacterium]|nr:acyltransferase family protein [Ardenticatenales bacterium]
MLNYSLQYQAGVVKRRFTGEYETDPWGLDWEFLDAVRPFLSFMYGVYWRVETSGLENVPDYGRGLLVSNHSGQIPFDAAMIEAAILTEHPSQRLARALYADWFATLPFVSILFDKTGQALAHEENAARLLQQDELVIVFPEGFKGGGKLFKDRYKLARFGRGGFVRAALQTAAPIIPVSVVGAEETYISLHQSKTLARLTGFPYVPISPMFPWLGLLGVLPLPTKWYIDFGPPLPLADHGPAAAEDAVLRARLSEQVRHTVQQMVYHRLARRDHIFRG